MDRITFLKWTGATAALARIPLEASAITANEFQIFHSTFLSSKSKRVSSADLIKG